MTGEWIDLGTPAVLEFSGPDAVRFLNGQMTQDVRRVAGGAGVHWSCVTDAKGRLQFRVLLMGIGGGVIRVAGEEGQGEALEARLTRYLIADDVDVVDRSGGLRLIHWIGGEPPVVVGVDWRPFGRFGVAGCDGWMAADAEVAIPGEPLAMEAVEQLRVSHGIPAWGRELREGMLPPEAGLEATDIAYDKGCYIGQEVISRIKSAGKVNRRLVMLDGPVEVEPGEVADEAGAVLGEITSVAPLAAEGRRRILAYLRRGVEMDRFLAGVGRR